MKTETLRPCLAGLVCAAVLAIPARAADPKPAGNDPEARKLLDEVVKAYKDLTAYSDQGEFVMAMTLGGGPEKQSIPVHLSLLRPNKLNLNLGPVRVVSDGKTLSTSVDPFKKYISGPAPKTINLETFRDGPAGAMLFGGPTAPVMFILTNLLVGDDPARSILEELGGSLLADPDRNIGGAKLRVLRIDRESGPDFRLLVDPATRLLKGIELVVDAKELSETLGQKVVVEQLGWTSGSISKEAPKPERFAFDPPKAYTKVESFAQASGGLIAGESKHRVNDLLGKPAPDFTFKTLDAAGKFLSITKADLAGKVVVIDFWATWCKPCFLELPEVQKIIEAYAKDKRNVVVIALSIDQRPSEIRDVRRLVELTLEQKHIKLTGNSVGKIALDPSGSIGEAFQVESLPTVVILDTKGVVQSTHIGFSPEVRELLTKDIDALLAGKSLVKPRSDAAAVPAKAKD